MKRKYPVVDLVFDYSVHYKTTAWNICDKYKCKNKKRHWRFKELPEEIYLVNGILERTNPLSWEEKYWLNVRKEVRNILFIKSLLNKI